MLNTKKQIEEDEFLIDLLIDFDEMGFQPTTLCNNPEEYAIKWKEMLIKELISKNILKGKENEQQNKRN